NGIVWVEQIASGAVLRAYDAADLTTELFNSTQAANNRDQFGTGNKFGVPTIANGKVYVGTTSGVGVFGLLNSPTPTPTPTATPTPTPTPTAAAPTTQTAPPPATDADTQL